MPKGPLLPSEFVPTKFSSATDKAEFGNALLHFLEADCPQELFTKKLYSRLSMTFGNIAHNDRAGFYDTWFTRARHKAAFVEKTLRWPCHGHPEFTFSDVEQAIQRVVHDRNYLARFGLRAGEALRAAELKDLERLEAKYRNPGRLRMRSPRARRIHRPFLAPRTLL
ncbi:hypothetical protein ACFPT7_05445 [Acidicapsa dinghuensis]|uniref:Uncharacterized protein n=1 Tax=Acidicapsa dinghuensis TaxID=2218256 RepID=A0ABW1EEF5_9BACT|nr:hypothetical protein [Acidicapsa dinghuensis]